MKWKQISTVVLRLDAYVFGEYARCKRTTSDPCIWGAIAVWPASGYLHEPPECAIFALKGTFLQLLLPHCRPDAHSLSLSQSPPPTLHVLVLEQQLQSVLGTPSHCPVGVDVVVVVVASNNSNSIVTRRYSFIEDSILGQYDNMNTFTAIGTTSPVTSWGWKIIAAIIAATSQTSSAMRICITITAPFTALVRSGATAPIGCWYAIALPRWRSGCCCWWICSTWGI